MEELLLRLTLRDINLENEPSLCGFPCYGIRSASYTWCCLVINVADDDVPVERGVRLDTGRVAVIRDDVMRD